MPPPAPPAALHGNLPALRSSEPISMRRVALVVVAAAAAAARPLSRPALDPPPRTHRTHRQPAAQRPAAIPLPALRCKKPIAMRSATQHGAAMAARRLCCRPVRDRPGDRPGDRPRPKPSVFGSAVLGQTLADRMSIAGPGAPQSRLQIFVFFASRHYKKNRAGNKKNGVSAPFRAGNRNFSFGRSGMKPHLRTHV